MLYFSIFIIFHQYFHNLIQFLSFHKQFPKINLYMNVRSNNTEQIILFFALNDHNNRRITYNGQRWLPSRERRAEQEFRLLERASRPARLAKTLITLVRLAREIKRLSEFVLGSLANILSPCSSMLVELLTNSLYNNVLVRHFPRLFQLVYQLFGITIKFNRRRIIGHEKEIQISVSFYKCDTLLNDVQYS